MACLIDTNVLSEQHKGSSADPGVQRFALRCEEEGDQPQISAISLGEIRYGIEKLRHRGDQPQADGLENWFAEVLLEYQNRVLPVDAEVAQLWGHLRVPHQQDPVDKLIAATAIVHGLTMVTRNVRHFQQTSLDTVNPFSN
ncbi:type II toxin-antitoxin system VapC family toxin [Silvimonas sp. JCM 19000]